MDSTPTPAGVADRVAAEILDMIARGDLMPGERLPGERQLAERMSASRVSIRAALQQLKTRGLLAAVRGGGTRVVAATAPMDGPLTALVRSKLDNLHDLADIRVALETWAARRAAERATPDQVAEIAARLDAMAAADRRPAAGRPDKAQSDVAFHVAIARATGSPVYVHILSAIRDILTQMLEFHRYELFMSPEDDRTILAHHRAVFEAIAARQPDAADAAMRRHLEWVLAHYDAAGGPPQQHGR